MEDEKLPPALREDRAADKAVRFGCGAALGLVVALASMVPVGLASAPGLVLEAFPRFASVYLVGLPTVLGVLALWRGERVLHRTLAFLKSLEDPFRKGPRS